MQSQRPRNADSASDALPYITWLLSAVTSIIKEREIVENQFGDD